MVHFFKPDPAILREAGFAAVAETPVLFDDDWHYLHNSNRYLRERALLEWAPTGPVRVSDRVLKRPKYPTGQSLEDFGRRHGDFVDWLVEHKYSLCEIEYTKHIVQGYQKDMQTGAWSQDSRSLSPSHINSHVLEAISYLRWAAHRGLRPAFTVIEGLPQSATGDSSPSSGSKQGGTRARAGGLPRTRAELHLPTPEEVSLWLKQLTALRGATKGLMSRLILTTAIRIQEAIQWRTDTLPLEPKDWTRIGDQVQVVVKYGAKGQKFFDEHGELYGPPRTISVPLSVANDLHVYRNTRRLKAIHTFVHARGRNAAAQRRRGPKPPQLFLSEATGQPFTPQVVRSAWKSGPALPFAEWSPHCGRHYWACITLLRSALQRLSLIQSGPQFASGDWITGQAMSDIDLLIRPQLGHISIATTQLYLRWVQRAFLQSDLAVAYQRALDSGSDGCD